MTEDPPSVRMEFISLFSGIGGFDLGFERAGMGCVGYAENDKYAKQVLAYHWPNVLDYGDVRNVTKKTTKPVDLVCGGFPCQDLSVAGKRAGLAGEQSGLWNEFHRIIAELRPRWVVIENVPGLLSSNKGRDMGTILGALAKLRYGYAYRVLDAQFFGVAQRRRRVFIVANSTDWHYPAKVLFESESCERHTPPSRKTEEEPAGTIGAQLAKRGGDLDNHGAYISMALSTTNQRLDAESQSFVYGFMPRLTNMTVHKEIAPTMHPGSGGSSSPAIAFTAEQTPKTGIEICPALQTYSARKPGVTGFSVGVRRLTPVECERLQGFPDGWTDVDDMSDTQRYRQLGNAVCVNVAEWIGNAIMSIERGAK